ncbi:MAG: ECF transporter S component [Clostridia bacterium]|nr:ECF transporter S component [Clostridia bacterium]
MKKSQLRAIAVSGIMGAIGFVLMLLEFPLSFLIPSFIKFDFSELPALITTYTFGPVYGIAVCLIKNLLHLFIGSTSGVGELSNFLLGAALVGIAGVVYRFKRDRKGALLGALAGTVFMAAFSIVSNYYVVYPIYAQFFGGMNNIIMAYKALLPAADSLLKCLVIFNLPFNIVKGLADTVLCFLIYKKLSPILKYGSSKNKG